MFRAICLASLALAAIAVQARAEEFRMPKTVAEADAIERADGLPITKFYDSPSNISAGKPGDLLRQEPGTGYQLPAGASAIRILYHSLDAQGRDVATSAAVLVPPGNPPPKGWPIIAWAHGTSGVARACAPSAMKDVYYGPIGLFSLLEAGFAIVATDYHGLGTEGLHPYMDSIANARDVIYAVPAARAAVPSLGDRWVVDGHSQGGAAAWRVAELEATLSDHGYLGAVSVAGATHLKRLRANPDEATSAGFYLAWIAYAVHARHAEFEPTDMLSQIALDHYGSVTNGPGCWYHGFTSYLGVDGSAMVKPGWQTNPWLGKFLDEIEIGDRPAAGPVFVIAGEGDTAVPIAGIRDSVARACKAGQTISFRSYPGLDHTPTMQMTVTDQIDWIRGRFAEKPSTNSCAALQKKPLSY